MNLSLLLRWIGCIALGFAILELCARTEDWLRDDASFVGAHSMDSLFTSGPIGRVGVPNSRFRKFATNSVGFRGPELSDGDIKILTFGASETFGLYEREGFEYPRQLERQLNDIQPSHRFEVINAAIPGMRLGRVAYLDQTAELAKPNHLIVYPSPANYIGVSSGACLEAAAQVSNSGGTIGFRLPGRILDIAKQVAPTFALDLFRRVQIHRALGGRTQTDDSAVISAAIQAIKEDLECIVDWAAHRDVRLLLVTHATTFSDPLDSNERIALRAWRRFFPELSEHGFLELEKAANDLIRHIAKEASLPLVDADQAMSGHSSYFADFAHFTDSGAERLASLLVPALNEPKHTLAD